MIRRRRRQRRAVDEQSESTDEFDARHSDSDEGALSGVEDVDIGHLIAEDAQIEGRKYPQTA